MPKFNSDNKIITHEGVDYETVSGVEINRGKIRLMFQFEFEGEIKQRREHYFDRDGDCSYINKINFGKCTRVMKRIKEDLDDGVFDLDAYRKYFPKSLFIERMDNRLESRYKKFTFKDFIPVYFAHLNAEVERGIGNLSKLKKYRSDVNAHILPVLGHVQLQYFSKERAVNFLEILQAKKKRDGGRLANKTISNIISTLSDVCRYATQVGGLEENLVRAAFDIEKGGKRIPSTPKKTGVEIISHEYQEKFIKAAVENDEEILAMILVFGINSGVRIGEIYGLDINNFNEKNRTIYVEKSLGKEGYVDPKSQSFRHVDLLPKAIKILKELKKENQNVRPFDIEVQRKGAGQVSEKFVPVFVQRKRGANYCFTSKRLVKAWRRIEGIAGLEAIELKSMRHTYASRMLSAGAYLSYIQHQFGHSSITTTEKYYARFVADLGRDHLKLVYKNLGEKFEEGDEGDCDEKAA